MYIPNQFEVNTSPALTMISKRQDEPATTSTRQNMAMVFVGVVLGLSFLAFLCCTTTRYLRKRRMEKRVQMRNLQRNTVRESGQSFMEWKAAHARMYDERGAGDKSGGEHLEKVNSEWESEICAICLEVVRDDQPVYTMSCAHVFHFECAARWYQRDATRTCPVCRSGLDGDV